MAEIIISSVIVLVCTAPVIIIGIVQYRSKEPVGFWSGKKPPGKLDRMYCKKDGE